ncbi:hypothetical protein [Vallitalea okinawensis]|uniref:hypothetical protein n=1 Tax=Vallitalea okinawensis TaxID=2078660 RepID=UPI000CFB43A5|nr:hypothetical protein [Vallitalea okinawensis]
MKKTIIGSVIMLSGIIIDMTILIAASLYIPNITSWSGSSKLWFVIFGAKQYGSEVVQSLFLGFPFIIGIMLTIIGLIILVVEYFDKEK